MSDHPEMNDSSFTEEPVTDDRAPLALALGLVTALVAGGLWAAIVFLTNAEIGFAAWGVGLMVGIAMSRVTRARTQQLAYAAAGLALLGLLAGKIFIFAGSTGRIAKELATEDEMLQSGVAWQLYDARELTPETLEELDRTRAAGDTLSDAVWASMREQAGARIATMTPEQKQEAATALASGMMQRMGIVRGVTAQLSLFDILWVILAVGTAYRMLAPVTAVPEPENA